MHTLALQALEYFGSEVVPRQSGMERRPVAELAANFHPIHRELANVVLVHVTHELSGIYFFIFLAIAGALDHFPQQQGRNPNQQPEQHCLYS